MSKEGEGSPLWRKLRFLLRTYRYIVSIFVLAVGILLVVLAVGDFSPLGAGEPFLAIDKVTDQSNSGGVNYNLAFGPVGAIVVIIGAYLVGAYYVARRRFEHLMLTKSKAEFLRNLPEIEQLLWELTPEDEQRYGQKITDLRIRR
ncbi:MAG: hypothetical protein L3K09_02685 [Thermoplasmata archaeon]|nr:hypothetical protein [Thermoplasmata archaeon]